MPTPIFYDGDPGPDIRHKLNELVGLWVDAVDNAYGPQGWAPKVSVEVDGERRVLRIVDWLGGEGDKPLTLGYIGPSGIVGTATLATDIRGAMGLTGPANTLAIGTVTEGAAAATITGTAPTQTLNLAIPKGNTGTAATIAVGTVTTGAAGSAAAVTNSGTTYSAVINFTIPRGNTGLTGPTNSLAIGTVTQGAAAATITGTAPAQTLNLTLPKGDAATIAVGTVTTGAPGTSVAVVNSGTAGAAVINFTIPRGDAGAGTGDVVGPAGATADHVAVFNGATGKLIKSGGLLNSALVGLGNVTNTSDANKPVSTAQLAALNAKAPLTGAGASGTWGISITGAAPWGSLSGMPAFIGAGTSAALALAAIGAAPTASPEFTGTMTFDGSITETPVVANTGTSYTITDKSFHSLILTGNCTYTFPTATAGKQFTLLQKQDGTGSRTVTWPASVRWAGGTAPTITATAAQTDIISFIADGTYWLGFVGGQDFTRA